MLHFCSVLFVVTSNTRRHAPTPVRVSKGERQTSNQSTVFLTATVLKVRLQCILKKLIQTIMLFETLKVSAVLRNVSF